MWQVVFVVEGRERAESIEKHLSREGFLVRVDCTTSGVFQIKTAASEAEEAHQFIIDEYQH